MPLADLNVSYVDSVDSAQEFLRWLSENRRPVLAIDTETTGLAWYQPNFLRIVQFGDTEQGWSIPFKWWGGLIRDALGAYDGLVVFQNAKFDMHALESAGLVLPSWRNVHDTLVMDHLLDSSQNHSLKPMAARLFGQEAKAGQSMLQQDFQKHGWSWATVPESWPHYWGYAALDTVLTARVYEHHSGLLLPAYEDQYAREMAVQEILYGAEKRGMLVDAPYTRNLLDEWDGEMAELQGKLEAFGISSPNSSAQIEAALRLADPQWKPDDWTDTGQAKLDKDVLLKLGGEIGPVVLRYRRLRKWSKAYLESFLNGRAEDGRLHPSIKTLGARTGRMSITDPPLQTLPRGNEIRNCIVPAPGKKLVSIDQDNVEYRVFAHYSQAPALLEAIRNGDDLHRVTAALAYNVPYSMVSPSQRQIAKNVGFGRLFGAGAAKIATTASAADTNGEFTRVTTEEVAEFIKALDNKVPEMASFMQQVEQVAKARLTAEGQAYIMTLGGRKVPVDSDRLYAGLNYLVQGSARDTLGNAILQVANAGLDEYIVLPIHDELLFEIPEIDLDDVVPELERLMTYDKLSVPLSVSASAPMDRWSK